jgi:hypothetical protein
MEVYKEEQSVDTLWPLLILAVTLVGNWILYFYFRYEDLMFFYVSFISSLILSAFIGLLRLSVTIEKSAIQYKMRPFHFKWQSISFNELSSYDVRSFSPIKEYGGWGKRHGKSGAALTIKGNRLTTHF